MAYEVFLCNDSIQHDLLCAAFATLLIFFVRNPDSIAEIREEHDDGDDIILKNRTKSNQGRNILVISLVLLAVGGLAWIFRGQVGRNESNKEMEDYEEDSV